MRPLLLWALVIVLFLVLLVISCQGGSTPATKLSFVVSSGGETRSFLLGCQPDSANFGHSQLACAELPLLDRLLAAPAQHCPEFERFKVVISGYRDRQPLKAKLIVCVSADLQDLAASNPPAAVEAYLSRLPPSP